MNEITYLPTGGVLEVVATNTFSCVFELAAPACAPAAAPGTREEIPPFSLQKDLGAGVESSLKAGTCQSCSPMTPESRTELGTY